MRRLPLVLALLFAFSPLVARADDPPKEEPPAPDAQPAAPDTTPADEGIAWSHDLDEAKKQAKDEGKALFVYLTPSWFECPFCKKLQKEGFGDADVQKYVSDNFVPVWIEDAREDPTAKKLGLSQEGYPNVAVYAKGGEFVGRLVGFGGLKAWFGDLKDVTARGDGLAAAEDAAAKDPTRWIEAARLLLDVPEPSAEAEVIRDRVEGIATLFDKAPAAARDSKDGKAVQTALDARKAWVEVESQIHELMQGVHTKDVAAEKAPQALEKLDAFLKDHAGDDARSEASVLAKKGFFLLISDKQAEAVEVAKHLLEAFPESEQAKQVVGALLNQRM